MALGVLEAEAGGVMICLEETQKGVVGYCVCVCVCLYDCL